ncbi:suppressor of fused domain protein [Saccharopolyspora sp. NPDC002686]|uniref:suppressor of fused domain protein n=1 Tax=Saccharopolyspora sp. NPDC002686 TaxID=3154541 RepID=UPI00331BB805
MDESTPDSGLLQHLEAHLGAVRKVESARSDAGNRGYDLSFFHRDEPPVSTVVSNGLRFQPVTSMMPQELTCSLWDQQEHVAHYLVDSVASMVIRNEQGLEYGSYFKNNGPIVEGTGITAVLAHPSPFHGESFNLFPDHQSPALQIITLLPITDPEVGFVEAEGADGLFEVFRLNRTNILDVRRPSAV